MEEPLGEIVLPSENVGLNCFDGLLMAAPESVDLPPTTPSVVYTDVNVVPEHDKDGLGSTVAGLKAEISALRLKQRFLDGKRREALNKILDIKGNIRVFCRIRPSPLIGDRKTKSPISTAPDSVTVRSVGTRKEFNVDRVFSQESTQEDVYKEVEPILRSALDGHNVCILAYGQTGTGKTYTMEGKNDQPGIVPRAMEELFRRASQDKSASFTLSMSMLEVYMGSLRDLLAPKQSASRIMKPVTKCNLSILTGSNGAVEIEGLTDMEVSDFRQANRWYSKGKRARSTSWTNVNEASSRSHCLTRITISQSGEMVGGSKVISKLWLADLGGGERLLKTGATGQTMDEGRAINLSLSALGDVIAALKKRWSHIPYRNSKLTQILSDSLGHGSKVLMIVHISPSTDDVGETTCSLSFARRVRAIETNRDLPEDLKEQRQKYISELEQQILDAEVELQKVRNQVERAQEVILESQQLLPPAYQLPDDLKGSPRSPLMMDHKEVPESPQATEKATGRRRLSSVPHFMAPTVCSRQRESAPGEITVAKLRAMRLGISKGPMDLLGSQSLGSSGHYLISNSRSSKAKPVACEAGGANLSKRRESSFTFNPDDANRNSTDSKPTSVSRNKKVSTSQPNFRVPMHLNRRRMSDLM